MEKPVHLTAKQKKDFIWAAILGFHSSDSSQFIELLKIFDRDGNGVIEKEQLRTVLKDIFGDYVHDLQLFVMLEYEDDLEKILKPL